MGFFYRINSSFCLKVGSVSLLCYFSNLIQLIKRGREILYFQAYFLYRIYEACFLFFLIPDPCYPIYGNSKHHSAGNNQKSDILSFRKQEYDNTVC